MIPVPPTSIKFTHDEDARLRALASLIGWSKCKVIRASIDFVDHLINNPASSEEPEIVTLARLALFNKENPGFLQRHMSNSKAIPQPRKNLSASGKI